MKAHTNAVIKAHLIRGAFYLVLLVAVCAIPFTLAQRNTTSTSMDQPKTGEALNLADTGAAMPGGSPTCTPGGTPGPWTQVARYPIAVSGAAVASDGNSIYAFGGIRDSGFPTNEAHKYDPVTNTWTALANMNNADRLLHAEYGGNGKIYVMGGKMFGVLNRIYDIGTNTWSTGAPVPVSVYDHGHAYWNSKIYVIGGVVGGGFASNMVYSYDVASDTWSAPLAPLPQGEFNMACAAINNKIYCANGHDFITELNNLYIYDIAGNSWTSGPNSPLASNFPAGTAIGGQLYMIGGGNPFLGPVYKRSGNTNGAAVASDSPQSFENTYLYDPVANAWAPGPSLNVARCFGNAATVNTDGGETAVIVGGQYAVERGPIDSVETSTLAGCASPTPAPITLSASGRKVRGINTVRLTWSGANSANIDVYRDAALIVTTTNDGSYIDSTGDKGRARYSYRVCETGTATCSNNVTMTFRQ
jgi:N-acetylneuraminic acid mutarotase